MTGKHKSHRAGGAAAMAVSGNEVITTLLQPGWTALAEWNEGAMSGLAAMNTSWSRFVERRLQEDLGLARDVARCRTLNDLWQTYTTFYTRAADDYQREMLELTRLGNEMIASGASWSAAGGGSARGRMHA